jgi:hypothetical protein
MQTNTPIAQLLGYGMAAPSHQIALLIDMLVPHIQAIILQ